MATNEKFVVYWLGFHQNPPAINALPAGIDVINLFLLNLTASANGTTLDYDYITSQGTSWDTILDQAHAAQQNGVKVCVSMLPPNATLIWNTIPDPETFAENVYNLVTGWGFDGIDIDPEQGNGVIDNSTFVSVVQALSKYFGPQSGTGLIMSFASYQLFADSPVLQPCGSLFDYVSLMGYFWSYDQMITEFDSYTQYVEAQNLLFGIGGDPWQTDLDETKQLASWEGTNGKGGMMEFNINDDTNYQAADAIIAILGT